MHIVSSRRRSCHRCLYNILLRSKATTVTPGLRDTHILIPHEVAFHYSNRLSSCDSFVEGFSRLRRNNRFRSEEEPSVTVFPIMDTVVRQR